MEEKVVTKKDPRYNSVYYSSERLAARKEFLAKCISTDFEVETRSIKYGTYSIESSFDEELNASFILKEAEKVENGFNAIVIGCFVDSAIDAMREALKIPVIDLVKLMDKLFTMT